MVGVTDAKVTLSSGYRMPLIAFGTAAYPLGPAEAAKSAIVKGIEVGYRHFDTAAIYGTEQALGDAIAEALELGIIKSREELFITSKLWICDTHHDRVELALRKSLRKLKLEYLDLYLVHWPLSSSPSDEYEYPVPKETFLPNFELKSVWEAMEECQSLGLTKSIGVSNLSCKKLVDLLSFAKIPPAVNEVELHPAWQQKKLREFCKAKGIVVTAYSVLGAKGTTWGTNLVMDSEILHKIAEARGKSVAQVVLRWAFEQDVCVLVKSFNEKRMKENVEIFDWALREEELKMISEFTPQSKANRGEELLSENGPYKSLEQLWDGEIDCYSN